jgi:hypothetical protein
MQQCPESGGIPSSASWSQSGPGVEVTMERPAAEAILTSTSARLRLPLHWVGCLGAESVSGQ